MSAILACAKECTGRVYTGERLYSCSDSQAALLALEVSRVTSELVCVDRRCVSCLAGTRLSSFGSLVIVGFMVKKKPMALLGRDRAVHSSVPNQQFRSHLMLVNSRSDCRRGTPNTGLPHQVWGQSKLSIRRSSDKFCRDLMALDRKQRRLVTGCCTLRRYFHIMDFLESAECGKCGQEGSLRTTCSVSAQHWLGTD
jgi:hypothetical protein